VIPIDLRFRYPDDIRIVWEGFPVVAKRLLSFLMPVLFTYNFIGRPFRHLEGAQKAGIDYYLKNQIL